MNRKILFIAIREPKKDGKGDQVILYHRIEAMLENDYSVYICILSKEGNSNWLANEFNKDVKLLSAGTFNLLSVFFSVILNFYEPLQVSMFWSKKIHDNISKLILKNEITQVHNILLRTSKYFFGNNQSIDLIDSMTLNFRRRLINSNYFLKLLFKFELKRLEPFEKKISHLYKNSFVVSNIDNSFFEKKASVIPVGVDIPVRKSAKKFNSVKTIIGFTGNMSYSPNIEAVNWFLDKVWSIFLNNDSKFEFRIVGRNPSSSLISKVKNYSNVKIIGEVPNIYDYIFENIDICVAPMTSGSGMQFKVIEAMVNQAPVILSDLAVGDINIKNNKECIICDSPESYYTSIVKLVENESFRDKLIVKAENKVLQEYSWDSINSKYIKHYN